MSLLKPRRKLAAPDDMAELDRRLVWRIAALLLDYPTEQTMTMLNQLQTAAITLPQHTGRPLLSFIEHAQRTSWFTLTKSYVDTFDMKRRSCLHLTYYAYGDTRKRGMALLRFKHAYKTAGVTLGDHELPDHLSVVLEFAATIDPVAGERLLGEHVPVLELLRLSLHDSESPYAGVLDAVCATLPPITTADRRKITELAAQGPPDEEVGLEPFSMDPQMHLAEMGGRR
ncbi:nitrate reductase molybdenum cofactor assembly chaperone [Antrihabitans sp. YC2-6]|uniref:nitrate reductase molybdenum cofactor assembly chaperone n=1 Tax=Antrihabitans sp. YC2-6 TaxID=2799498 RepID=UPI0018F5AB47|nr:nitrate reductase molybdenum cofactor assembly chaperone [Antrihabitans sp. YC2-6]MBJ8348799.1 nitrate reductase molybdenum cofactor assembly chaperone [Antrihabitans sp. YC2-6]